MLERNIEPIYPGEVLWEDFMKPLNITQNDLSKALGVPIHHINDIVNGKQAITADTALRLGRYFGVDPRSWMNLQVHYDLEIALQNFGEKLNQEIHPLHYHELLIQSVIS
jgi:addiction module HigA family antidote